MSLLIVALAVYGLVVSDNLIRKIMCLTILESMIILAFLGTGYAEGRTAPILSDTTCPMVDPVPQALMLTAIVIGVCFNSLALAFIVKLYQKSRTLNASELHEF